MSGWYSVDNGRYAVNSTLSCLRTSFGTYEYDKVPFDLWEQQGYLTVTPGAVVDYSYVEQYLLDLREEGYDIQEINYDKWNATHFAQIMMNNGFEMVEIPQTIRHLSSPTKDFRKEVFNKKIIHFDDPLLNWAVGNAVQRVDAQENIMLDKSKSTERIDPIAAVINGFYRAMSGESDGIDLTEATNDFLDMMGW